MFRQVFSSSNTLIVNESVLKYPQNCQFQTRKPLIIRKSSCSLWDFKLLRLDVLLILLDFSLTVKAATAMFIAGCGSAISSAKEGKSGFIYNLVKS